MTTNMKDGFQQFLDDYIGTAIDMAESDARERWAQDHPEVTERDDMKRFDFDRDSLDPDALESMTADCRVFWNRNGPYILAREEHNDRGEWTIAQRAATAFYLNRNGHGSGFWDYEKLWGPYTDKFDKDSQWFGESTLEPADDKTLYLI